MQPIALLSSEPSAHKGSAHKGSAHKGNSHFVCHSFINPQRACARGF